MFSTTFVDIRSSLPFSSTMYSYSMITFTQYINKSARLQSIASTERLPLKIIQLDVSDDSSVKDAIYTS